jgi:3-oxoacyl-[acyl-carrier protein] reductase
MPASNQRAVVVTGGSRGIGRAICEAFAGPEALVFFNYNRAADEAENTRTRVAAAGGEAVGLQMDVSKESQVKAFFDEVVSRAGRIDVLVNNAGVTRDGLIVRMKAEHWDTVLDTNLKGAFNCIKYAAKTMMKQRSGRIINISSVVGAAGNPGQANYVAAKAGLIGLTKAVARELAPRGITANAVAPGFVETDMTRDLPEKTRSAMLAQIPLGRPAEVAEVAEAVLFLASDQAAYITGQVLHVNGGMYM